MKRDPRSPEGGADPESLLDYQGRNRCSPTSSGGFSTASPYCSRDLLQLRLRLLRRQPGIATAAEPARTEDHDSQSDHPEPPEQAGGRALLLLAARRIRAQVRQVALHAAADLASTHAHDRPHGAVHHHLAKSWRSSSGSPSGSTPPSASTRSSTTRSPRSASSALRCRRSGSRSCCRSRSPTSTCTGTSGSSTPRV